LDLLGVERVIVVDDQFTPPWEVMLAFEPGEAPELENLPAPPEDSDYDAHVAEHWANVPVADKLKAKKLALKVEGFEDPTGDPTGLRALIGDRSFRGMTLHQWEAEATRQFTTGQRALILFDVNFQQETGDPDDEAGLDPAARALKEEHEHIIGLLTTKTSSGGEGASADAWAGRAGIDRADLVVVNKNLLGDPENPEEIGLAVQQIRAALQASQLSRLRAAVESSVREGLADVGTVLSGSSPRVLEDLVFKASREGGEWEGDTWFRLYGTLGFDRARRKVALDKRVRRAIADVRNLLHARPQPTDDESIALAEEVQKAECYADAEYLNHAGLPIANGDIFRNRAGTAFVLVDQPCDLMLRPDGRARDPRTVTLLPIKLHRDSGDGEPSAYRLPPGAPLTPGDWEVRFRPEYHVAFDVLDMVSFNTEGRASLRPPRGTAVSPLLPGLQRRYDEISKSAADLDKQLEQVALLLEGKHITKQIATQLRHSILHAGGPFKATLHSSPTPFAFDCLRIGRLSGTYADALLAAHAVARSRTVHAHELTRIVSEDG
jgi:hypothetical protein